MHAPTLSTYAFEPLSKRHNQVHHSFDKSFSTRMTRALSWLERAEQETDDLDAGFVFYWISFNATYSMSIEEVEGFTEMDKITQFLDLIIQCDEKNEIYDIIWSRFTREIRGILNNPFIFKDYWICVAKGSGDEWKDRFEASKKVVNYALSKKTHYPYCRHYFLDYMFCATSLCMAVPHGMVQQTAVRSQMGII